MTRFRLIALTGAALALAAGSARAQDLAVPSYSSLPGATNTLYLDFGGFNYSGTWDGKAPGVVPAYHVNPSSSAFTAQDLTNIQTIYSRVAEKFAPFNVNVTTIDPAAGAGRASSDADRQAYYEATTHLTHTIVGGTNRWFGGGGGVSYLGTFAAANPTASGESRTNWVFSAQSPNNTQFVGEAAAHEIGHSLGLDHQSVLNPDGTVASEYRGGSGGPNGSDRGPGSKAPTMGVSYYAERGLWASGPSSGAPGHTQNDVQVIVQTGNNGVSIRDDGVGHGRASASALALSGTQILGSANKGVIVPVDAGGAAFTDDYFRFTAAGATRAVLNLGVPTGGIATLDGTLSVLDAQGNVVARSATASLGESLTLDLAGGDYFAVVSSAGNYGDMGSFTLSGSLTPVPEPAAVLLAAGVGLAAWRQKSRAAPALAA